MESRRPFAPPDPYDDVPEPDIITYDDLLSETDLDFNKSLGTSWSVFDDEDEDLEDDYYA